ncbi:feruloyl-CoA synthase [Oricola thermophila]|uniref:Feruloyl-CoA synthase n=1 Tax=Oricola thermophila TaxID=2742145 RepID=A0A6N1VFY8_9HYPH|nr:feruloyl-CoA synthase [Oricola thermophila]QKV17887.1 feruloyl-CoA synthase [Oricola thermophila]
MSNAPLREIKTWSPEIDSEQRPDGTWIIRRKDTLGAYPDRVTDRLVHWAERAPDRPWMAERDASGEWRKVTYGEALVKVRAISAFLLENNLSAERPLLILSHNSIEHALMALGAQHAGIPSAAVSTAYSLISEDCAKLKDIAAQLTPGMVFAQDGSAYQRAIEMVFGPDVGIVVVTEPFGGGRECHLFDDVVGTQPGPEVDAAHEAVGPDTVAKFLFTSGTTGSPKAVITTHRMLCSNIEMATDCYAFMRDEPPVVVDWAPWSHVASGNKVFNLVIHNGGTYHIDHGKPSPAGIKETIRNLRDVSPTWYFNVPAGYEMLVDAMETDDRLRESFFRRLRMMMYAAAAMGQHTWDRLNEFAVQTTGHRVFLGSGLGATETSPFALMCMEEQEIAGNVGVPAQGIELKLVPHGDKLEARLKGPNVTPGYWRNEKLSREAFDEEGFYRLGDALRFAVPGDPARGFHFDGRITENFKLRTGTWVGVGALRAKLVDQFEGYVRDVVLVGENRDELGAILIPFYPKLRALIDGGQEMSDLEVLAHDAVRAKMEELLDAHAAQATGSATRVVRAIFLSEELSFDAGEITDKGSVNQRAVLRNREELAESLYNDHDRRVFLARKKREAS